MNKQIVWLIVSCLAVLSLVLVSCATATTEEEKATPGVPTGKVTLGVTGAMMEDPDPHSAKGGNNRVWKAAHVESLVSRDEEGNIVPRLAKSWTIGPDGMYWDFELRKDVKFHDGSSMTAEDVKYSFERYIDPKMKSGRGTLLRNTVESVEILDPYKVRFHFIAPDPAWLDHSFNNWFTVGCKKVIEEKGDEWYRDHPVTTGPFKFLSWETDNYMEWEEFTGYYDKERIPTIKTLRLVTVMEPTTQVAMLKTGQIDIADGVSASLVEDLETTPGIRIDKVPVGGMGTIIAFLDLVKKVEDSPFNDLRVRLAVNHAIDNQAIINNILYGHARVGLSIVFPHAFGYNPDIKEYQYDPAKAKALLAEAGYPNGFKTVFNAMPGGGQEMVEAIAGYLKAVGIETEIVYRDAAAHYGKLRERSLDGIAIQTFQSEFDAAFHPMSFWWSKAAYANYFDDDLDALLEKTKTMDTAAREKALKDVLWYGYKNAIYAQGFWSDKLVALGPRIKSYPLRKGDYFSNMYELIRLK